MHQNVFGILNLYTKKKLYLKKQTQKPMKNIFFTLILVATASVSFAQASLSKSSANQASTATRDSEVESKSKSGNILLVTINELKESEKITVKTHGKLNIENFEIKTSEDKMRAYESVDALKIIQKTVTFTEFFSEISGKFNIESHQVVSLEKTFRHYFVLSAK